MRSLYRTLTPKMQPATDDDFGPFVGPLDLTAIDENVGNGNQKPHEKFLAEAKANTDRNRAAVLDELLHHQDDPLYWHRPSHSPPAPPIASTPIIHSTIAGDPSSSSSSSSWFSTLHERIPPAHQNNPFTIPFFQHTQHTNTTPPAPSTSSSTLTRSRTSPFASHIFVPISGAPGFKPERYNWDKGFSSALEVEAASTAFNPQDQEFQTLLTDSPQISSSPPQVRLGEYIDKRSGSVELLGRRPSTVPVLTVVIADKIRPHLPALSRLPRTWNLIYSLDQHGISLKTLYFKCEDALIAAEKSRAITTRLTGMLFVVKDSQGAIFGAWVNEGIRLSRGNEGYYGGGESFLWKCDDERGELNVFKWTGKNDYVALCEPGSISFGGGDGSYGLYLDDTLFEGTSARSVTFANDILCSSSGPRLAGGAIGFECVGVEVWGVG